MISLIVPVHNHLAYTKVCLDSILTQKNVRPVIVNNGSRQKTSDLISEWTSAVGVKPVVLPINKGFAGGVNAGLRSLGDDLKDDSLVCVMHNDCQLFENCLEEMTAVLQEGDDDLAVVLPKTTYDYTHSSSIPELRKRFEAIKPPNKDPIAATDIVKLVDSLIPDRTAFLADLTSQARLRSTYSPEIASYCMLTRGMFFKKFGAGTPGMFWDEDFWPRYWEDRYWWVPIEREGYTCSIANRAFVLHFGGITADGPSYNGPSLFALNQQRFEEKCLERDRKMGEVMKAEHQFFEEVKAPPILPA